MMQIWNFSTLLSVPTCDHFQRSDQNFLFAPEKTPTPLLGGLALQREVEKNGARGRAKNVYSNSRSCYKDTSKARCCISRLVEGEGGDQLLHQTPPASFLLPSPCSLLGSRVLIHGSNINIANGHVWQ